MRVLDVSPLAVSPPGRGSAVRTYNLLKGLARRHEVRQFAVSSHGPFPRRRSLSEKPVPAGYREWRFEDPLARAVMAPGLRSWPKAPIMGGAALRLSRPSELQSLLRWADVVLVEFPWQFATCRRLAPSAQLVYASHNVESEKFRSWAVAAGDPRSVAGWMSYVERAERQAVSGSELVTAVRPTDRDAFVRRFGAEPARVAVIPNGADTATRAPVSTDERRAARRHLGLPERPTAIFVGQDMAANRRGLVWVERMARAHRGCTFVVAGGVSRRVRERVVVAAGFVEDLTDHLAAADVVLCPIEHGGGTKIKLLEGMAAGLPVIAFPESVQGIDARDGEHLLVADHSTEALGEALERLTTDPALARALGSAARALVADRYEWSAIADGLSDRLEEVVAGTGTGPARG